MTEEAKQIVLGSDSGTFWKGGEDPWTDNPATARAFTNPREAWEHATKLQTDQADYLEESPIELHVRNPEMTYLTHKVTSMDFQNNRPALRRHWRTGFGEALPPDLPAPDRDDGLHRLEDYLVDVDWDALRARYGSPEKVNEALDPRFRAGLKDVAKLDSPSVSTMLRQHVPRDIDEAIRFAARKPEQSFQEHRPVEGLRERPLTKGNEISRDRTRERDTSIPSPAPLAESRSGPAPGEPTTTNGDPLPAFVRRHFVRADDQFYYRQKPEQLAFETRGETFRAHDSSVSVATAMVELAESRGWSAVKVKGSKDFRRLVRAAAAKQGIAVDGYTPTAGERAMLEQDDGLPEGSSNRGSAKSRPSGNARDRSVDPLAGTVVDHPFQHDEVNSPSYFVALRGASGKVTTHWGKDLDRAIHESGAAAPQSAIRYSLQSKANSKYRYVSRFVTMPVLSSITRRGKQSEPPGR